ncbi:hypothetical protein LCGC14_0357880 [marine sediment metagenome]|uniref:Uncharacterized protein n=1 Tax=marine sediment metagenome TaxID=412755 RepID=A0A0F9WGZ1_9ZZZZ
MEPAVDVEIMDTEVELQVFDEVSLAVEAAKKKCADIVLKYDTPKDIKDAKSFIYDIRLLKAPITQAHKMAKAQLIVDGRAMDAKKNMLIGALESMIEEKYAPIQLIEDAEAKKKAEEERMEAERQAEFDAEQAKFEAGKAELAAKQAEFEQKERDARIAEEAEKKAAEDVRQAIVDAEFAKIAAETKARQDATNAENARKQAIVDAENAKAVAVQKAKDEAAAEATEREQELAQERRAEEARIAEEQAAEELRTADVEHRRTVHREILAIFTGMGMGEDFAKTLITAISKNHIPHTKIEY